MIHHEAGSSQQADTGEVAESSHLEKTTMKPRENKLGIVQVLKDSDSQWHVSSHNLLILLKHSDNGGPSIYMYEPMRTIHIQTTTHRDLGR